MLQSNIAVKNIWRLVPASFAKGQLSPDCNGWSRRGFLNQHGLFFFEVFLKRGFARERNGGALGVAFEMFIMHQRFSNQADVQIGAFQSPDLAGL